MKRIIGIGALTAALLAGTTGVVAASAAQAAATGVNPDKIASATLGHGTRELTSGTVSTNGVTISKARANGPVRSLVADVEGGKAVVAVLGSGNEARFDLGLPDGARLEQQPDGTVLVAQQTDKAVSVQAVVHAPWAKDATGRSLPTNYSVEGNTLVQHVDTTGAQYPVVADPWIAGWGWYGCCTAVVYVEWSKSETHNLQAAMGQGVAAAAGVACGEIPYWPAKAVCAAIVVYKYANFAGALSYASANNRCFKARVPYDSVDPIGALIDALTFYSVPC